VDDEINQFFDTLNIRNLVSHYNVCEPGWKEIDCRYIFHKFYFFTRGEGYIKIEDNLFKAQRGDLFFIPAQTTHSYWHNPQDPVKQYWSHFTTVLGEGRQFIYHKKTLFCHPPEAITRELFSQIVDDNRDLYYSLDSKIALMGLLRLFFNHVDYKKMIKWDRTSLIHKIDSYLEDHITHDISLKDLAEIAHQQPNYFISTFKKQFGTTPMDYVNTYRLRAANQILSEDKNIKISTAALMVGFKDYRYFSRMYKKKYGMTPSRLRNIQFQPDRQNTASMLYSSHV
jgi:AraC family transcriptional regulator of arabinose operon